MAKKKIAVLGGGMASLATVYHLTNLADWRDRYEITVYQMGWRLGGKCASGRNLEQGWRIEEHGLHMLFGWYTNTLEIIRGCYQELGREADLGQAFLPCKSLVAPEWIDDHVVPWEVTCPTDEGIAGGLQQAVAGVVKRLLAWIAAQLGRWSHSSTRYAEAPGPDAELRDTIRALARADSIDDATVLRLPALAVRLVEISDHWEQPGTEDQELLVFLIDAFRARTADDEWWQDLQLEAVDDDDRGWTGTVGHVIRRLRVFVDFCATVAKGLVEEIVWAGRSWFDLDGLDLRGWLRRWQAGDRTVGSAIVDAIYGAVFSSGTPGHEVGAGTILQAAVRARFFFRGASIYRPDGSIGDVVFAPLYEVLRSRGVRFEFFHRVERLELSPDRERVAAIRIKRQARLRAGSGEYQPLLDLPELPGRLPVQLPVQPPGRPMRVWPATPIWDQLAEPDVVRVHDLENWWDRYAVEDLELRVGRDFDQVVFGISIAALQEIFPDALQSDPKAEPLRAMVRAVPTTQTQAMQLWFAPDDAPGWSGSLPHDAPVAIPYQMPFDTIADMRHILRHEPGMTSDRLLYLCAALSDDGDRPRHLDDREYPARQRARAEQHGVDWLETWAAPLLQPRAPTGQLVGDARAWLRKQYLNVPKNPSDRYVLCPPGSVQYRLRADESGYHNLVLAGDWLKTAVSAGCLEAATMGGIQAARALDPAVPKAHGDWLPDRSPPVTAAPRLVIRDGDLGAQPPIGVPELEQVVFVLRADPHALQQLCDRELNLGAARRYGPLGPFVLFYAASLVNRAPPFGSAAELDFGFWVPLVATPGDQILFYTPYLWVDNSWALAAGRGLFGFPKHLGELAFEVDAGRFSVAASVLPELGGTVQRRPLIDARCAGPGPRRGSTFASVRDLVGAGAPLVAQAFAHHGSAVVRWLAQTVRQPTMAMVFLKQVPAAGAERRPSYRAIIESAITVAPGPRSFAPLAGPFELRIHEYESHRIVRTLGLHGESEPGRITRIRPDTQVHMRFAATVQPGIEVWRDA